MKLSNLAEHCMAIIEQIDVIPEKQRRLYYLGIYVGATIEKICSSPFHDPCVYMVNGVQLALRKEDSDHVEVREL